MGALIFWSGANIYYSGTNTKFAGRELKLSKTDHTHTPPQRPSNSKCHFK